VRRCAQVLQAGVDLLRLSHDELISERYAASEDPSEIAAGAWRLRETGATHQCWFHAGRRLRCCSKTARSRPSWSWRGRCSRVRTARELDACRALMAESGLLSQCGFELWVMAEVPSVLFNLERYAALGIAGISIGSNDLTQLMLGADRDSELVAEAFDERDPAVADYLRQLIPRARALGLQTSICGQAPSVYPEYAELLVHCGIDAISVNVEVVDRTRRLVAATEARLILDGARNNRKATP
jgi:hypothetical protein